MKRELTIPSLMAVSALALAACGGDGGIEIDGAWARTSPSATDRGAVYFEITAAETDILLSVSVDASVAGSAEIHQMVTALESVEHDDLHEQMHGDTADDPDHMDEMDEMDEMPMTMQEMTAGLPLPADRTVVFEPGSFHVMLLDLVGPLETGETFEITLDFAEADDMTVAVTVRETAP